MVLWSCVVHVRYDEFYLQFARSPLIKGLYWETWYNNDNFSETGYIYYENKLLGLPRIRQLKVHSNSCVVHEDFSQVIRECYDSYAPSIEDTEPVPGKNHNESA